MSVGREILDTVPFLRDLDADVLDEVLPSMRQSSIPRGRVVFHQGGPSDAAYVVLTGQIRITVISPGGAEMTIDVLGRGDSFGLAGLAGELPRISTATPSRPSTLLHVPTDTLRKLVKRSPQVFVGMLEQLVRRLGRSIQEHVADGTGRVYARVAVRLLALSQGARTLPEPLSHRDLASMVGSTRATVTRVLQDLRKRGILDVDPLTRRLIIRELGQLSELSDAEPGFRHGAIALP